MSFLAWSKALRFSFTAMIYTPLGAAMLLRNMLLVLPEQRL
jgi:hypothetical protein